MAQTLLRWGLEHGTSVIPKSSNPKHIQASGIVISGFSASRAQSSVAQSGLLIKSI